MIDQHNEMTNLPVYTFAIRMPPKFTILLIVTHEFKKAHTLITQRTNVFLSDTEDRHIVD